MTLTANREVDRFVDLDLREFDVKATTHIYKGSLVGLSAGYARPLVAGDVFLGVAYEEVDNNPGANGDKKVRLYTIGDFELALAGAAITSIGALVYASADDTLTFTATANSLVGKMSGFVSAGVILLRLDTF